MLVKIGKIAEFGDYGSTMFTVKFACLAILLWPRYILFPCQ